MTRPLPDSEAYFRKQRGERRRRIRRAALVVLLVVAVSAIVYLRTGGRLPDLPRWLDILLRGGSSEGTGGVP